MEKNDVQIAVLPSLYILQIEQLKKELEDKDKRIEELSALLDYERKLREEAENKITKKKKNKEEKKEKCEYTDFKSDGKRKPHAADSIRSYSDFKLIQDYYLEKKNYRDYALWTIGVSLGLRISDLLSLKFKNFLNEDMSYKERVYLHEQKTGKINLCLITESVKDAMKVYLDSLDWKFDLEGYVFPSKKTKGKMYEEYGWKILSDAGKALNLPITIGSHTMRKSFANIAACVDKSCIDMNSITKIQGLLNHSDQKVTMKYLGSYQDMFDRARVAVSDFVLGKTEVGTLIAGNQYSIDDIVLRLEELENLISARRSRE